MALESRLRECLQLSRADADRITDLSARLARSEEAAKRALASRGPPSAAKLAARVLRAEAEAADATRAYYALQLSLERGRCRAKMLAAENASLKVQVAALRTARRREVAKSAGTERRSKAPASESTPHAPRPLARNRQGSGQRKQPARDGPARAAERGFSQPDPGPGQLIPVPWVMWRWKAGPASLEGLLLDPALGVLFRRTHEGDWPVPVGALRPLEGRGDERSARQSVSCNFGPSVEEALRLLARGTSAAVPFAPPVFRALGRLATPCSHFPAGRGREQPCAPCLEELVDSAARGHPDSHRRATRPLREALERELREETVHVAGAWSGLADWLNQHLEESRAALCLLLVAAWHVAACTGSVEHEGGLVPELAARALSLGSLSVRA